MTGRAERIADLKARLQQALALVGQKSEQYIAERQECDRLRAQLSRAKEALKDCADGLESELKERYAALEPDRYPHNAAKFERDMEPVIRAAAVLKELEG